MKKNEFNMPSVKLDDFEGPLDLLLHLIRKAQMSIYDIKIAEITAQYLQYLHSQESLMLSIAGEYLVMAAKLTEIKGKMLLPHDDLEEEVEEDPRNDLVDQLLEYQMFKSASETFRGLEAERKTSFSRPELEIDVNHVQHLAPGIQISDLQKALQKVLARQALLEPVTKKVQVEEVSLEQQMDFIKNRIQSLKNCYFEDLFIGFIEREVVVTTFMAILEMAKKHQVILEQAKAQDSITVKLGEFNE